MISLVEINKDSLVECQWCNIKSKAIEWNDLTFAQCFTREMKRAFRNIYDIKVWGNNSKNFYKCPNCGMWSRGNQLILFDEAGEKTRGLGGRPIIRLTSENN